MKIEKGKKIKLYDFDRITARFVENSNVRYLQGEKGSWYCVGYYNSDGSDGSIRIFAQSNVDALNLFKVWSRNRGLKFLMIYKE
jgi:hypothetical protein